MGQLWSEPVEEASPKLLHHAIRQNDINEIFRLLDAGVSVNAVHEQVTPLYAACQRGVLCVVQSLLMQGADINAGRQNDQDTPVLAAVRCNQRAVVKELLAMGVDVNTANAGGDTALTLAVATGNTELVQDLLAAGCNPAKRIGSTKKLALPLHEAIEQQDFPMIELLCSKPGLTNVKDCCGRTAMHLAVRDGRLELVRLLLDHHSAVNVGDENDVTPLHIAAAAGLLDIARVLLQTGSDVNVTRRGWGREGFTPLHEAALSGHDVLCRLLCECGADRDLRDFYGKSALHVACEAGHLGAAGVLLRYGADPVLRDLTGATPLIYATREGAAELVSDIITRGHDLDSAGQSKRTALHIAACNGFEIIVKQLLEAGAKYNIKDQCNWTPLEHALSGNYAWCLFYLFQHGHSLPPIDLPVSLLDNMMSKGLSSLAVLLQLGWRPATEQLGRIKLKLSQTPAVDLGDVDATTRRIVEKELRNPSSLLRLGCNSAVASLARHTNYSTVADNIFDLEVPGEVTSALCLVNLQQYIFLVD